MLLDKVGIGQRHSGLLIPAAGGPPPMSETPIDRSLVAHFSILEDPR